MLSNTRRIFKMSFYDGLKSLVSILGELTLYPLLKPRFRKVQSDINFELLALGKRLKFYFPTGFSPKHLSKIYWEIFVERIYEHKKCKVMPGDWVLDAGSCEGFFIDYCLRKGANVVAFEPNKSLFEALERTFAFEVERGTVKLFQLALGDRNVEEKMKLDFESVGASKIVERGSEMSTDVQEQTLQRVSVVKLDDLYFSGKLPKLSFIKADIEGYEMNLLMGAKEVIRTLKPRLAICYYHKDRDFDDILNFLQSLNVGYSFSFNHEVIFAYIDSKNSRTRVRR